MKILVNSAYGYLGAVGLTRLADVDAAHEVTRRGREVLGLLCRELAARGATLLEATPTASTSRRPRSGTRWLSGAWSPRSPPCCRRRW